MSYYLGNKVVKFYFNRIKTGPDDNNAVVYFWLQLLLNYFRQELNFGIENEVRALPQVIKQPADWIILYTHMCGLKKFILMSKRKAKKSSGGGWKMGLSQLTKYMKLVRAERNQEADQDLYGAINIGTHTRFYVLNHDEQICKDFPGTDGKVFELCDDEKGVHEILTELVEIATQDQSE